MAEQAKDPVCGMAVAPEHAAGTAQHGGGTFYFCSPGCKHAFEQDRSRYLPGAVPREAPAALRSTATQGQTVAPAAALVAEELRELCHEVGNALTTASGYAQFLLRRLPAWADERDRRALQGIVDSVDRACRLVHGRPPGGAASRPVQDLAALLERVSSEVPPGRWPDLRVRCVDGPLLGRWDPERLEQVLVNLIANAAKYSPPGTPIEIEASRLEHRGWARVVVRDHGIGIEEGALEAIFAGRRTARARKTAPVSGVGLRLSRRLVEAEGGLLWAMNVPGGGSALYLELPLDEPDQAERHPPAVASPAALARDPARRERARVLLVEDGAWTRTVLVDLLERAGYAVAQASNGQTGLRLATLAPPDMILLDLLLPERSGLDVLNDLKSQPETRTIPVVVMSGHTDWLQERDGGGADGAVRKPFEDRSLLREVERVLAARAPAGR